MKNITLLGTGAMGSRIAKNLLKAGFKLRIYNRTKKSAQELINLGASYFENASEAVKGADVVLSILKDDIASKSVWFDQNAIKTLKKDVVVIESSTLSFEYVKELSTRFKKDNISFLDAPVLGSRPQAESGVLIFLVGGKKKVLQSVQDILDILGSKTLHVGDSSNGVQMKLAINAYFSIQVSALGEIMGMLENSGISKDLSAETFSAVPTTAPALAGIANLIKSEVYDPMFPIDLVEKDLKYTLNLAQKVKSQTPMLISAHQTFKSAQVQGLGGENIAAVAKLYLG